MTILTNSKTGDKCEATSRAWWTSASVDCGNGRIEVAKIEAVSQTLRHPTDDETQRLSVSKYSYGPEYTGRRVTYMLGLTDSELAEYGLTPGILDFPQVIDGERPATNSKVISAAQHEANLQRLYSEGYDDAPIQDNTPYQKGDDQLI